MKKFYEAPISELIVFCSEDIINVSNPDDTTVDNTDPDDIGSVGGF